MRTPVILAQATSILFAFLFIQSVMFAQSYAIQVTLRGGWTSPTEPVRKVVLQIDF